MKRALPTMLFVAALGACGRKDALKPLPGHAPPPAAATATAPSTPDQLLRLPSDAAPTRVDDLINRPERPRGDDPFDLPPKARR